MKRLSALLLLTLAAGCATPPVQVVPARCPQLPEAPQILREPPPTLQYLPDWVREALTKPARS